MIFNKNLSSNAPQLSINDWLRLGSTFHGLHEISSQIAPVPSSGISSIETDIFRLQCMQSLTGIKFVVTTRHGPSEQNIEALLNGIYSIYADYVLKNPFYEIDMPIRCDLFNQHLERLIFNFSVKDKARGRS